jgi:hypothetical protein
MPDYDPPSEHSELPHRFLLPEGSTLWHVHPQNRAATEFPARRPKSEHYRGRFDGSAAEPYVPYNAGLDAATALATVFLGGIPYDEAKFRTMRRVAVKGKRASAVATATDLHLVSLCDAVDLSAVAQDVWLIHSDEVRDPRLDGWTSWIREKADWADGFLWPSKGSVHKRCIVLFDDRCKRTEVFDPDPLFSVDLDNGFGAVWLNGVLVEYRVRIMHPQQ